MIGNPITLTSNVSSKTITTTATQGQTNFTVTGGYRINQISVFRNGVKLSSSQYQARDGVTVTLTVGANAGDTLEFQVFDDFRVANALDVNVGGSVNGSLNVNGVVTATSFVGNITGNVTGNITGSASTASFATTSFGLSGTPNLNVGIITGTALGIATNSTSQVVQIGSGSTIVVVDNQGDLGIGTATVPTRLYVQGTSASNIVGLGTTNANTTLNFATGNNFSIQLVGNIVLNNPSGMTTGQSGIVLIQQDSGGSRTVGFGSFWDFPSSTPPTLSTGANALDCLTYFVRSSTSIVTNSLLGIGTL
jgi:hypothetical protein